MFRGYQCIVIAIGIALACPNHANAKGDDKKADAEQSIATSLDKIATVYDKQAKRSEGPDKQAEPCKPGDDRRYSDLCAQWKAADAAADSAWWAWVSGLVGAGSLLGVIVALALALHSNWIARDTAKRQLRAYVGARSCTLSFLENGSGFVIQVELVNSGQTPAYNFNTMGESFSDSYPLVAERPFLPVTDKFKTPIMPGEQMICAYRLTCDNPSEAVLQVLAGNLGFYVQGVCEYDDAFGIKRKTTFRYVFGGRVANSGGMVMHATEYGNTAT